MIQTPRQAFELRDKLGEILRDQPGQTVSDLIPADAERLLMLGIIDVDALIVYGLSESPESHVLTADQLKALPRFSMVETSRGRAWKRDEDDVPWSLSDSSYASDDRLADMSPRLVG